MKTPEIRYITGNMRLDTPEGAIGLSFAVNITEGVELVTKYLGQLPLHSFIQDSSKPPTLATKPRIISPAKLGYYARRRKTDPIFALIPQEELGQESTRVVNVLRRTGVTTLEELAGLTDDEIAAPHRGVQNKTRGSIRFLREAARKQLEITKPQVNPS